MGEVGFQRSGSESGPRRSGMSCCRMRGGGGGSLGLMVWRDLIWELHVPQIWEFENLRNSKGRWRRVCCLKRIKIRKGAREIYEFLGCCVFYLTGVVCWSEEDRPKVNVTTNEMDRIQRDSKHGLHLTSLMETLQSAWKRRSLMTLCVGLVSTLHFIKKI